ncbi:MAG: hypothetical protein PVF68_09760 [Acidobacteriota bacterium]
MPLAFAMFPVVQPDRTLLLGGFWASFGSGPTFRAIPTTVRPGSSASARSRPCRSSAVTFTSRMRSRVPSGISARSSARSFS